MYRLRTLGALSLERDGAPLDHVGAHRKALALLAVLAAQGSVARDRLMALLWSESDEERARGSLKQALHVLRAQLDAPELLLGNAELRLNPDQIASDVNLFSRALEEGDLATAVRHYTGPFLEGAHLAGAPEFERWVDAQRTELARQYVDALEQLARTSEKRGDHASAVGWWRRLQAADPLNARVAVRLMQALDAAGDRAGALQHARVHEELLRQEFGVGPDSAVNALAARLRSLQARPLPTSEPNKSTNENADMVPAGPREMEPSRVRPSSPGPGARLQLARSRWMRPPTFLMLAGLVAVGGGGASLMIGRGVPVSSPAPGVRTDVEQSSIAVLPFVNMSPEPDQEYFSDGITEELTNRLSKVDGLRVAARTSAFQFKGENPDVREAAAKLGVATVLEGSVRKSGGQLRITAQLIDARNGYHLWSEAYDRDLEDVFAVQDEISHAIVDALRIRLAVSAVPARRMTNNAAAYDLYLRGRYFIRQHSPEGTRRAAESFQRAVALDPTMAKAYIGLADIEFSPSRSAPGERFRRARAAVQMALALDSTIAEAHASMGWIKTLYDRDYAAAERHIKRAFELDPAYTWTYNAYTVLLTTVGRLDESLPMLRRAHELAPSIASTTFLGAQYLWRGQNTEAIAHFRSALDIDSSFFMAHWGLGRAYLQLGRYENALKEFERPGTDFVGFYQAGLLGYTHARAGNEAEARRILAELRKQMVRGEYVPPTDMAAIHIGLGELPQALDWLERHETDRGARIFLKIDPIFDPVRSEPRFQRLLQRLRLS
ncbi:MAG: tetratricopeptide repeat protein [Gemmatimonadaceae bacterium]